MKIKTEVVFSFLLPQPLTRDVVPYTQETLNRNRSCRLDTQGRETNNYVNEIRPLVRGNLHPHKIFFFSFFFSSPLPSRFSYSGPKVTVSTSRKSYSWIQTT